jgi:hypothetical protein
MAARCDDVCNDVRSRDQACLLCRRCVLVDGVEQVEVGEHYLHSFAGDSFEDITNGYVSSVRGGVARRRECPVLAVDTAKVFFDI